MRLPGNGVGFAYWGSKIRVWGLNLGFRIWVKGFGLRV
jgi:hypothetical protein